MAGAYYFNLLPLGGGTILLGGGGLFEEGGLLEVLRYLSCYCIVVSFDTVILSYRTAPIADKLYQGVLIGGGLIRGFMVHTTYFQYHIMFSAFIGCSSRSKAQITVMLATQCFPYPATQYSVRKMDVIKCMRPIS